MPNCDLMINMQQCAIMTAPAAGINPATVTSEQIEASIGRYVSSAI
jgi:hypothetical protein